MKITQNHLNLFFYASLVMSVTIFSVGCAHKTYVLTDDLKSVPKGSALMDSKTSKDGWWVSDSYMNYIIEEKATE